MVAGCKGLIRNSPRNSFPSREQASWDEVNKRTSLTPLCATCKMMEDEEFISGLLPRRTKKHPPSFSLWTKKWEAPSLGFQAAQLKAEPPIKSHCRRHFHHRHIEVAVVRPHPHWTRREKQSNLGYTNPVVTTSCWQMEPGSHLFTSLPSRITSSVDGALLSL